MDKPQKPIPLWHGLMYSTGILLIVCGIPATVLISFYFTSPRSANLSSSEALRFGLCMVACEALLAGILLFVATMITKRRSRE
jgi:small-conductance mechanosensitive channel